ncbi:HD-GYP domain-containing protein [Paenibacillus sp. P96]|uniref:HD-GYP domain-containing protein n=1 Tax=Paenibacillus zeirhizosphaerae TaxID=2987519 RepID=A0ABT9FT61_9BACL|nr:HD-GYP domain-containing protein [Paenibacillus sp. P96]MDP4097927.1 HD-GYP domain-containing protein [Paenibacillus sp. P96]
MRVHVTDAQPGDCLQSDAYNDNGVPVLTKGTTLRHEDISKLLMHNIEYIDIESSASKSLYGFAPDKPVPAESLAHVVPLFTDAIDGVEAMFLSASASGQFNSHRVDELFGPIVNELANQKDVVSMLLMLDQGDEYTYNHSLEVGVLSYYIALWLGYSQEEAYAAGKAGYLHDIGKCMIPAHILNKPSKLTEEEFREVKKHTQYGYDIIQSSTTDEVSAIVALQHHERENGTGYPHGLFKEDIHPFAQITAVADVYSAMTSNRVYQSKQELLAVLREMHSMSFGHLDPVATQTFIRHMLPNFIKKKVLLTNGRTGTIILNNPVDYFRPLIKMDEGYFIDLAKERELAIEEVYI